MKKYLLILFVFFIHFNTIAQDFLEPIASNNFGLNHHTNRDIGMFSHIDSNGDNLIVGTTERDTTFTDIIATKLDANLQKLWIKIYSVPTNLSYDVPFKTFVSNNNELYIIGRSSLKASRSNGLIFIIKYDVNGNLLYNKILGNLDGSDYADFSYLDANLNDDGSLNLVYAPAYSSGLFKFLEIDNNGNIGHSFDKIIENQGVTGKIKNGKYYLLIKNGVIENSSVPSFRLHRINDDLNHTTLEITDIDFANFYKQTYLPDDVKISIETNESIILTCSNSSGSSSNTKHKINVSKFDLSIGLIYSESTLDTENYYLIDTFLNDQNENIIIANNLNTNVTEFLRINNNQIEVVKSWDSFLSTGFKKNSDNTFFLTTSSSNINLFSKDLEFLKAYNTTNSFELADFNNVNSNQIVAIGTRQDKMFPESDFETQLDIIAEKIESSNIINSYEFSGRGTSLLFQQKVLIDNDNNYVVFVTEKMGPQAYFIGTANAPLSSHIYKFDDNLNLLWDLDIPQIASIVHSGSRDNLIRIDSNSNIYVNVVNDGDPNITNQYTLIKVSSEGEIVFKINSILAADVIVKNNDVYLASFKMIESGNFFTNIYKLDGNTGDLVNTYKYDGLYYCKGFISPNGDVYFYMNSDLGSSSPSMSLYNLDNLIFTRQLHLNPKAAIRAVHVKQNGDLVFVTYSSSVSYNNRLHRLKFINHYNSNSTSRTVYNMLVLDNGKIFVRLSNDYSRVYNEDLSLFSINNSFEMSGVGSYLMKFKNNVLYARTFDNTVRVFDEKSTMTDLLYIDGYVGHWYSQQDKDGYLITTGKIGNQISTNQWYSWGRGYIKKYTLDDVLAVDDYSDDFPDNNKPLIYPNPTKNLISIKLNGYSIDEATLFDMSGKKLKAFKELNMLDLSNFASGIYLLKIRSGNKVFETKVIKQM